MHVRERRRHKTIDTPEQVILRDALIEPELIEKTCLIATSPTHHRRLQARHQRNQRNHCSANFSSFFDSIGSIAPLRSRSQHFRFTSDTGRIVAPHYLMRRARALNRCAIAR
jgi:hypothetical protein